MLADEYRDTRYKPPTDAAYRKEYEKGWRSRGSLDGTWDTSDAWDDGRFDHGAGRPKWHMWYCRQAGGCWAHTWKEEDRGV